MGRRSALAALASMGTALAMPQSAGAVGRSAKLDLNDPHDALYAFGKIWGGYGEPVIGSFHGLMYARMPGQRLVPLFNYVGVGVVQAKVEPNGDVTMKSRESGYFTDLVSGDILETWHNPFTDERVEVYHFYNDLIGGTMGPTFSKYILDGTTRMNEGSIFPDANGVAQFRMPWQDFGDDVMMTWDYAHLGDVPPKLRAYMEKHAPEFLTLPAVWPTTNSRIDTWSCYAMDVPPENSNYPWRWAKEPRPTLTAKPPTGLGSHSWAG